MNVLAALKCVRNNTEIGLDEKLMVLSVTFFYVKLMHCLIKGRDGGWGGWGLDELIGSLPICGQKQLNWFQIRNINLLIKLHIFML